MLTFKRQLLLAALALLTAAPAFADDPAPTLPGGATALTEAHGDWSVRCGANKPAGAKTSTLACSISQQLLDQATKRRVLLIGLGASDAGGVKGTLVMPFGLDLDSGVTFQIDDGPLTAPVRFKTCVPAGCIIPVDWPASTVKALGAAQKLKVAAKGADGQPASFTVSMNGFGSALGRAVALVQAK